MKIETRELTITAVLAAICLILGLTPIGYIPIPPIEITLMCIPVIIGTISQGLRTGLIMGFVFGLTSFLTIFIRPSALSQFLFTLSPLKTILLVFIPRMLVPVTTWLVYRAIAKESKKSINIGTGVAAFTGSITNTVLFLGMLYLIFLPEIEQLSAAFGATPDTFFGVLAGIGAVNGLPEAAVAILLCIPIVYALSKIKRRQRSTKTEN